MQSIQLTVSNKINLRPMQRPLVFTKTIRQRGSQDAKEPSSNKII